MPTVQLADGTWRQTAHSYAMRLTVRIQNPAHAQQAQRSKWRPPRFELHADEWLPMLFLHYRWIFGNARAQVWRSAFPLLPPVLSEHRSFIADRTARCDPCTMVQRRHCERHRGARHLAHRFSRRTSPVRLTCWWAGKPRLHCAVRPAVGAPVS